MTPTPSSSDKQSTIAVVGLGYVGLPLAVEFGKKMPTLGLDLSESKVAAYRRYIDPTGEVSTQDLQAATQLQCHTDPTVLKDAASSSSLCPPRWVWRTSPTSHP